MKAFLTTLLLLTIFQPTIALAGFNLVPSIGTYRFDPDNDTPDASTSFSQLEIRGGYTFDDFGLFLGVFYALGTDKFIQPTDHYAIGPMVGYKTDSGSYVLVGYTLFSEQDRESGGIKYASGEGPQVSIGHLVPLMEDIYIAPEITWKSIEYSEIENLGVATSHDRSDETVYPSITVWFKF